MSAPTLADLDDGGAFTAAFNRHSAEAAAALARVPAGSSAKITVVVDLAVEDGIVRVARRRISSSLPGPATASRAATPDLFAPDPKPEPAPGLSREGPGRESRAPKTKKARAAKAPASRPKRKGKT